MTRGSFEGRTTDAAEMEEGAGARVFRAFPTGALDPVDPFVLLDDFRVPPDAGFPEHPHGGFEAVTYMLSGELRHTDSTGVERTVREGEAQRITTGSGIRHSEMPAGGEAHGLQLWVNLPRELKEAEPGYGSAGPEELPREERGRASATTVVGEGSPLELEVPVRYEVVELEREGSFDFSVPEGWNGVLYVVSGELGVDGSRLGEHGVATYRGGGEVTLDGVSRSVFAALAGEPIGEEIRIRGSFVE